MAMRTGRHRRDGTTGGRSGAFIAGICFAVLLVAAAGWAYLRFGRVPVAVADAPWPLESSLAHAALNARIRREAPKAPFGISEDVYESGAKQYVNHCAGCHGLPGAPAGLGAAMFPHAPQLWKQHAHSSVVGVSDDDAGETFWKIDHGIRLSGMPAYSGTLRPEQEWQIALLLKNADQPLPDPVRVLLSNAAPRLARGEMPH